MAEVVQCPGCRRRLSVPEETLGRQVKCPSCAAEFLADPEQLPLDSEEQRRAAAERQHAVQEIDGFVQPAAADEDERDDVAPRRPPRRRDPYGVGSIRRVETPAPRRTSILVLVLVGLLCFVVGSGLLVNWFRPRPAPPPVGGGFRPPPAVQFPMQPPMALEDRKQIREAFVKTLPPLADKEVEEQLQALFKDLGDALQKADTERALGHFDLERMFDELAAVVPQHLQQNRGAFAVGMRAGFGQVLKQQGAMLHWTEFEIKNIKQLPRAEAAVIVRHQIPLGTSKLRWWVIRQAEGWKIYDFEDLDMGMRVSSTAANFAGIDPINAQMVGQTVKHVQEALVAVNVQRNPDFAEQRLQLTLGRPLPKQLEALRSVAYGLIHMHRGRYQDSLASLDQAHAQHPDMPVLDLLKAFNYNRIGAWDKALRHIDTYQALLGDDAVICHERGYALHFLQRYAEARAMYRKALDYNPKNADSFLNLLRTFAPGDQREDLAARFAKLDRPHENFLLFAEDCRKNRDGESLQQLAQAMRKIDPELTAIDAYTALAHALRQQPAQASASFKAALAKEKDAARRQDYIAWYLAASASGGSALEAYAAVPDARLAFRVLAAELKRSPRHDDLRKLLAAHERQHADDGVLPFYQGEIHVQEMNYDLAENRFRAAWGTAPDAALRNEFRGSRILARYYLGQILPAYAEIGPARDTFQQLASMCYNDQKWAELQALVDAHAKAAPHDLVWQRFGFRVKIRQGEIAEGVKLFQAALPNLPIDVDRTSALLEFLIDMSDMGKPLEGYEAAPDGRAAFPILANDLLDNQQHDTLKKLIAAHRVRHGNDTALALVEGGMLLQKKAWAKAAALLRDGLQGATPDMRLRYAPSYVTALYESGRWRDAYQQSEAKTATFQQLATLMQRDRKAEDWEALIKLHQASPDGGAEADAQLAGVMVLGKRFDQANALVQKAYARQGNEFVRQSYVGIFVQQMFEAGKGMEGYRAAPAAPHAFSTLAGMLVQKKKDKELEALLTEHQKKHAQDPWLAYYQAELHLLRGEAAKADKIMTAAHAQATPINQFAFRLALLRARIQSGHVVKTWQELGSGVNTFEELAQQCLFQKNPGQLEALLAAYRQTRPDEARLMAWELDLLWLRKDYEGALKLSVDARPRFNFPAYRLKAESYQVRSLIKLKRAGEALRAAEAIMKGKANNQTFLVMARAAQSDVDETIAETRKLRPLPMLLAQCYSDEDLGPILRSEGFRVFRDEFPETSIGPPGLKVD